MCQTMSDEFRTINVRPLLSSPQVVSGDPSEKGQDGFPITHVGNDGDEEGCPIKTVEHDRCLGHPCQWGINRLLSCYFYAIRQVI